MKHFWEDEEEHKEPKKVSSLGIVKQLFFDRLDQSKIFPYPRPPLEEKERIDLFCHKLRLFGEKHIDPIAIDRHSKIPMEVINGLAKLGMLGLSVPQKYGGLGMPLTAFCKALEVISQRCSSTAAFLTAHQSIGYKAILLYGTPEQKEKWLPPIAKGECIAAFALTEANAGSDPNAVETKAIYDQEKNVFYLTGRKQWITNGSFAKVLTVMAKVEIDTSHDKKHRLTAFIVTPDMPGFKVIESSQDKFGMRGIQSSILEFNNMEVPVENVLGKLGDGLKIVLSVHNYGRIAIGASCTGPAKLLVDHVFKYARDRFQFKKPLSNFELVKEKLAKLTAFAYAIDAVTFFTAGKVDAGEKDFMLEAAIVKVFSTETLCWMIFETMQIFGGKAMFTDMPYELMMRDCRPNMIVDGSNDVMRQFISTIGIKDVEHSLKDFLTALKSPFALKEKMGEGFSQLIKLIWPVKIEVYSPLLQKEAKMCAKEIHRFGKAIIKLLIHYGDHVADNQLDLERIAIAVINIYTTLTVLSKVDGDLERVHGKAELLGHDIETAKFYCQYALKKAQSHLSALFDPQDKDASRLSDLLNQDL